MPPTTDNRERAGRPGVAAWTSLILLACFTLATGFGKAVLDSGPEITAAFLGYALGSAAVAWVFGVIIAGLKRGAYAMFGKGSRFFRDFLWASWIVALLVLIAAIVQIAKTTGA